MLQSFQKFERSQRISFLILIFLTILSLGIGFDRFVQNQLNYSWFLFLGSFLMAYKVFVYNLVMIEDHIRTHNWFQVSIDSLLFFFAMFVNINTTKSISTATFPNQIIINFLVINLLFFVGSYLNRTTRIYFAQLANLGVIAAASLVIYYLQVNQSTPTNIYVILLAAVSFAICLSEFILFLVVSKLAFGKNQQ